MTYTMIEDYTLDFTGGSRTPLGWAIHWWGDPAQNPTFDGILNVLITRSAQKSASVNFMAESGKVACLVDPFTVAWAQGDGGNGWGNLNLVSVECNPRCTAEDRETVAELIADQNIQNGIPIVLYPHKNFTSTACPGVWEQWIPWLTDRAKQIVAEKTNGTYNGGTDEVGHVDSISDEAARKIADALVWRDVPWYGFDGNQPASGRTTTTLGIQLGWLDTAFAGTHRLIGEVNNSVKTTLEALKQIPEVDNDIIDRLGAELEAKLKSATENLSVTLEAKKSE